MELLAAIDLLDGRAVRLRQGDYAERTSYGDPAELAAGYAERGCRWLHVVDLEAARGGSGAREVLDEVLAAVAPHGTSVQFGGGVRDAGRAEELLAGGVERVVLGTAAIEEDGLVARLAAAHPGRIAVGLDHRRLHAGPKGPARREVAVGGWLRTAGLELGEALARFEGLALGAVVVTDITRDGMLAGPDLEGYGELLERSELPIVASGGIATAEDLAELAALGRDGRRLAGAIVGRALLDGRIELVDALAAAAGLTAAG